MLKELDFEEYKRWLQSVELDGTSINTFMKMAATLVVNSANDDQKVKIQAQQILGGE